jgi:phage/conjugal plasmid C-4 type zinc finger TraR family protein
MSDIFDRASEQEELTLANALREQQRRAGLAGKTAADSAEVCEDCDEPIPQARRVARPGCQTCIECQSLRERTSRERLDSFYQR